LFYILEILFAMPPQSGGHQAERALRIGLPGSEMQANNVVN
jgi:hypothetical protein